MELVVQLAKDDSSLSPPKQRSRTKSERRCGVEEGLMGCIRGPERRGKSQGMAEDMNPKTVVQLVGLAGFVYFDLLF